MNQITFPLLTALYLTLPIQPTPAHPTLRMAVTYTGKGLARFLMSVFSSVLHGVESHGTG
jgi:hypothetical protein